MAEYRPQEDGTIIVHNSGWRSLFGWSQVKGRAVPANTGDASLIVSFSGKTPSPSDKANYSVMDTDYDTYSIVYSSGRFGFDYLWVLAREKQLDDDTMKSIVAKINEKLPHYNFEKNHRKTYQGGSWYDNSRPTL